MHPEPTLFPFLSASSMKTLGHHKDPSQMPALKLDPFSRTGGPGNSVLLHSAPSLPACQLPQDSHSFHATNKLGGRGARFVTCTLTAQERSAPTLLSNAKPQSLNTEAPRLPPTIFPKDSPPQSTIQTYAHGYHLP